MTEHHLVCNDCACTFRSATVPSACPACHAHNGWLVATDDAAEATRLQQIAAQDRLSREAMKPTTYNRRTSQ